MNDAEVTPLPFVHVWHDQRDKSKERSWRIEFEFAVLDGRVEPVSFKMSAITPAPITGETIRAAPIGVILTEWRKERIAQLRKDSDDWLPLYVTTQFPALTDRLANLFEEHGITDPVQRQRWIDLALKRSVDPSLYREASSANPELESRIAELSAAVPLVTEIQGVLDAQLRATGATRPRRLDAPILDEVASLYRNAYRSRMSVVKAVADHYKISESAAAKRIHAARLAGKLGPARPGSSGGEA